MSDPDTGNYPRTPAGLLDALQSMTDRSLERVSYLTRVQAREAVQRASWDPAEAGFWSGLHRLAQAERDRRAAP